MKFETVISCGSVTLEVAKRDQHPDKVCTFRIVCPSGRMYHWEYPDGVSHDGAPHRAFMRISGFGYSLTQGMDAVKEKRFCPESGVQEEIEPWVIALCESFATECIGFPERTFD